MSFRGLILGLRGLILGLTGLIWGLRRLIWGRGGEERTDEWTDIRIFTPLSYRTLVLRGRCPALPPLLQLITPSIASVTADHVRSLDDLFVYLFFGIIRYTICLYLLLHFHP